MVLRLMVHSERPATLPIACSGVALECWTRSSALGAVLARPQGGCKSSCHVLFVLAIFATEPWHGDWLARCPFHMLPGLRRSCTHQLQGRERRAGSFWVQAPMANLFRRRQYLPQTASRREALGGIVHGSSSCRGSACATNGVNLTRGESSGVAGEGHPGVRPHTGRLLPHPCPGPSWVPPPALPLSSVGAAGALEPLADVDDGVGTES